MKMKLLRGSYLSSTYEHLNPRASRSGTAIRKRCSCWKKLELIFGVVSLLTLSGKAIGEENPYQRRTFTDETGQEITEVIVPGKPPEIKMAAAAEPFPNITAGVNILQNMPAFTWSYGCSATSAAMIMGYYDNWGYSNMYTGPANGGVCPMNNETYWGSTSYPSVTCGECPLSATHQGVDGRSSIGHVDDYWINYGNGGPDPYVVNGWTEHTPLGGTGDFMGTNQAKYGCSDGATVFYFGTNRLYNFTGCEPGQIDGCHGMRDFAESRGYTVAANFTQLIYPNPVYSVSQGFTFNDFKVEIDAGRPVMIQVLGHSMVGYGYEDNGNTVYIRDTWDHSSHTMTWGGAIAV